MSARVAGRPVPGGRNRAAADQWRWGFTFVGPTTEGVEVDLTLSGPARLLAVAATPGLPAPALDAPMPATRAGAISAAVQTFSTREVILWGLVAVGALLVLSFVASFFAPRNAPEPAREEVTNP